VSIRPEQPEPFLRGCVFPAVTDVPYPRADPAGAEYLPADVWDAAQLPVGVRLELSGNARTIRVWYKTTRASLGYRGESAGCSFVAYRAGQKVAVAEAVMGEGMAELVMSGRPDLPVTVYFPEGMQPLITGVAGVEETMVPAPAQPRWLAYGDAITQGWLASAPAMAWPAVAGRKLGLDVCNFGYAGTARGETTSAVLLAETPAEVVSIAFGLNNWSRVPHTTGLMAEEVRCFLAVVRRGHPDIPIVVVSPTARPDAEDTPNRVGATLAELRLAMEETVLDCVANGDKMLFLVEGLNAVGPEDLEDGIYPGDEGHRRLAAAVSKVLVPHLADLQAAAERRWSRERSSTAATTSSDSATPAPTTATATPAPTTATAAPVATTPQPETPIEALVETDAADIAGLKNDPPDAAWRNFDLPDIDSVDRESLNDALLDALSPNRSSVNGSGSSSMNGSSFEESAVPVAPQDSLDDEVPKIGSAFPEMTAARPSPAFATVEAATADTAAVVYPPVEFAPVEYAVVDQVPVDQVPVAYAPGEFAQADMAPATVAVPAPVTVEMAPVNVAPVESLSVEMAPINLAPLEPASVEMAPITMAPAATAPAEPTPVATAPVVTAPMESVPVTTAPVATAPVETPPIGVPSPTTAPNGEVPQDSPVNGTAASAAPAETSRRDTAPVDIAIADMVVAALTLATNGADDVIYAPDTSPGEDLQWAEAPDPSPF